MSFVCFFYACVECLCAVALTCNFLLSTHLATLLLLLDGMVWCIMMVWHWSSIYIGASLTPSQILLHKLYRHCSTLLLLSPRSRDSRKSRQKMSKNTAHFCENRKNHGKFTAIYVAANLLKLVVSNSRKIYKIGKIRTTMTSRSRIPPVRNKAHGLW